MLCASLDGCPDQSANEPAKERGSDLAPVLRVESAAVVAVVVVIVVVAIRLMMLHMRRKRRCVTRYLVLGFQARVRYMCFRLHSRRCSCGVPRRCRGLSRPRFPCGSLHRRRCFPLGWSVSLRCGHSRAGESAADRERHHNLLYCLVHCRVPFVIRASPFSRLHRVRTIRRNFLTKFSRRTNRGQKQIRLQAFLICFRPVDY